LGSGVRGQEEKKGAWLVYWIQPLISLLLGPDGRCHPQNDDTS
jgi:hypothetical protein